MEKSKEITQIQAAAVIISTIIGVGVLPLPRLAAQAAHSGAPFATFIALLIGFFGLFLVTTLGMRFPRQFFIQYSQLIFGRWIAAVANSFIVIFFIVLTALTAREFGGVVITAVLMNTPLQATVLAMLSLAALSARHDIRTFSYIHLFYTPIVLAPVLLIVFFSLNNSNILYLMPIFGYESGQMLPSILTIAALLQGSFVFTMIIPYMRHPKKALRSSFWGFFVAGLLYLLIVTATVSVFGPKETTKLLWPTLELAKTTALPANVLERLDAAFLAVWVTAVFTTLFSSYYLAIHMLSKMLGLRDHRMMAFSVLPTVFLLAMQPQNIVQLYNIIEIVGRIGLCITIVYPACLLLVAVIRKVRGDGNGNQNSPSGA